MCIIYTVNMERRTVKIMYQNPNNPKNYVHVKEHINVKERNTNKNLNIKTKYCKSNKKQLSAKKKTKNPKFRLTKTGIQKHSIPILSLSLSLCYIVFTILFCSCF